MEQCDCVRCEESGEPCGFDCDRADECPGCRNLREMEEELKHDSECLLGLK
jgi:hypothetical protein